MSSKLESLKWEIARLIPRDGNESKRLSKTLDKLFSELAVCNADNFEAILPVGSMDMGQVEIQWSKLSFGEDYEVSSTITGDDPVSGGHFELNTTEKDETIEKIEEQIAALGESDADVEMGKKLEELKENIENADPEYTELMWDYSWQPNNREVDKELADRIPQVTWVEKLDSKYTKYTDRDGDPIPGATAASGTYLTLSCIGQDNGPSLMAYAILAFGSVPEQYMSYWNSQLDWTRHVIGDTCFLECAKKLGVEKVLKKKFHQIKVERAEASRIQKAKEAKSEIIRKQPLREDLRKLLQATVTEDDDGQNIRLYESCNLIYHNVTKPLVISKKAADHKKAKSILKGLARISDAWDRFTKTTEILDVKPE